MRRVAVLVALWLVGCSSDDLAPVVGRPDLEAIDPPLPAFTGEPLPAAPVGEWRYVEFADARCRDGSPAGIGVRRGSRDDLVIFFEGGGACFNGLTCFTNPSRFDAGEFADWAAGAGERGIFARRDDNPVADWSAIYVPYCTGDVHAGDQPDGAVPDGPEAQAFVGFRNMEAFLRRIVPTFADPPRVLVTGVSAGGYGAGFQLHRLARVFARSQVTLLDDSGPVLRDMYLAPCLQARWRSLWNLTATLPTHCEECFAEDGGGLSEVFSYLRWRHPNVNMGLLSHERDATIRIFFGFGLDECAEQGELYLPAVFREGLYDLREEVLRPAGWASYFADGDEHTFLNGGRMYATEVAGVPLTQWIEELLAGEAGHVSP